MYVPAEFENWLQTSVKKSEKKTAFTADPISDPIIDRVAAGETKVFRDCKKKQITIPLKPDIIISDSTYKDSQFQERVLDFALYQELLRLGFKIFVWTGDEEVPYVRCNSIEKIKKHILKIPRNNSLFVKKKSLLTLPNVVIFDSEKIRALISRIKLINDFSCYESENMSGVLDLKFKNITVDELKNELEKMTSLYRLEISLENISDFSDKFIQEYIGCFEELKWICVFGDREKVNQFALRCEHLFPGRYNFNLFYKIMDASSARHSVEVEEDPVQIHYVDDVNLNTNPPERTFDIKKTFIGEGCDDDWHVIYYRKKVKVAPEAPDNFIQIVNDFQFTSDAYSVFQKNRKQATNTYMGEVSEFTLTNEWQPLPSLSPSDVISHIESSSNIKLGFNKAENLYYIKADNQNDVEKNASIRFVLTANHRDLEVRRFDLEYSKNLNVELMQELQLDATGNLVANEAKRYLLSMSEVDRITALRDYIEGFDTGDLEGVTKKSPKHEKCNAIFQQRKGSCYHHALIGYYFLNAAGIETRMPSNGVHAYCEVKLDGIWRAVDMGGAKGNLNVDKLSVSDHDVSMIEPLLKPKVVQCPETVSNNQEYYDWFRQQKKRNNLIVCRKSDQIDALVNELQASHKDSGCESFYIDDLDEVCCEALASKKGKHLILNGHLIQFLKTEKRNKILFVNFSKFNKENVGYYSLFDDVPNIKGYKIPSNVSVVAVVSENELCRYGDAFTSRLHFKSYAPEYFELTKGSKENASYIEDDFVIQLFENDHWREELIGRVSFQGKESKFIEGQLTHALKKRNPKTICVKYSELEGFEEVDTFLKQLALTGQYYCNGNVNKLSNIKITTKHENNNLDCSMIEFEHLNSKNRNHWDEVLSLNNYRSYTRRQIADNLALDEIDGFVKMYAGKELVVLLVEALPFSKWAKLLECAKQNKTRIRCLIKDESYLPYQIARRINVPTDSLNNNCVQNKNKHQIFLTNDIDCLSNELFEEDKENTVVLSVSEQTEVSDLIGCLQVYENHKELDFIYREGALVKLLRSGKRVILTGSMTSELETRLATLWSERPHLWVNNHCFEPEGKCVLVSNRSHIAPLVGAETILTQNTATFGIEKTVEQASELMSRLDVLQKLFNVTKKSLSYEPEPSALTKKQIESERVRKVMDILKHQSAMMMLGNTGSGKSYCFHHFIATQENVRPFEGVVSLKKWACANNDKINILFIDEINLQPEKIQSILDGIFSPTPGIIVDGEWLPLTENHKVVFAGNPVGYGDRDISFLVRNRVMAEIFSPLPIDYIKNTILIPAMELMQISTDVIQQSLHVVMPVFEILYREGLFTPRNVLNIALKLKVALQKRMTHQLLKQVLSQITRDEMMQVGLEANHICYSMLKHQPTMCPSLVDWENLEPTLFDNGYIVCEEHKPVIKSLHTHLLIRQLKQKKPTLSEHGVNLLLLEGESGIGKSALVVNMLKVRREEFVHINSSNYARAEKILLDAFHAGKIVVIDELNTFPISVEKLLNALLSGYDLDGNTSEKPGFMVIATQNPSEQYYARKKLPKALVSRCEKIKMPPFKNNSLIRACVKLGCSTYLAKRLVKEYLLIRAKAKKDHELFMPTPRDLFRAIKENDHEMFHAKLTYRLFEYTRILLKDMNFTTERMKKIDNLLRAGASANYPILNGEGKIHAYDPDSPPTKMSLEKCTAALSLVDERIESISKTVSNKHKLEALMELHAQFKGIQVSKKFNGLELKQRLVL